jgi:hypothetical protein
MKSYHEVQVKYNHEIQSNSPESSSSNDEVKSILSFARLPSSPLSKSSTSLSEGNQKDNYLSGRSLENSSPSGNKFINLLSAILKGGSHKRTQSSASSNSYSDLSGEKEKRRKIPNIRDFEIIKPISRG